MRFGRLLRRDGARCHLQVSEKRAEAERELRRRERLEKETRDLKAALGAKQAELKTKQVEVRGPRTAQIAGDHLHCCTLRHEFSGMSLGAG